MAQTNTGSSSNQLEQMLAAEARLTRLHRLFKTQFNVTEPSLVLEPYLFLGNCISAQDINRLASLGIRYILNVAIRDVELCPYYTSDIRILTLDLRDDDRENILRAFDQAFAFIDEAKKNKSCVLVHCSHGQSRSPAIVIAYLMRTYHVSLEQCLVHVVKARPCVLPNDGFLKQLILYDRFLVDRRRRRAAEQAQKMAEPPKPEEVPAVATVSEKPKTPTEPPPVQTTIITNDREVPVASSTKDESIHVIPIQVSTKRSPSLKREKDATPPTVVQELPVKTEKRTTHQRQPVQEKPLKKSSSQKNHHRSKLNASSASNPATPSKRRENHLITTVIDLSTSGEWARPHSAYSDRSRWKNPAAVSASANPWEIVSYSPDQHHTPKQSRRTGYITEIYDKATNRFIPMPSY